MRLEEEVFFLVVNGQWNLPEKKLPSASEQQTWSPSSPAHVIIHSCFRERSQFISGLTPDSLLLHSCTVECRLTWSVSGPCVCSSFIVPQFWYSGDATVSLT